MKSGEDRGEAGERRSLFGDSGLAQAYENGLELGEIGRVVAHRRPGGAKASNGEGRNEGETDLNRGTGLIETAKLRESRAQHKIYIYGKFLLASIDRRYQAIACSQRPRWRFARPTLAIQM
jgi:hypothetical protein